ncbi:formyltransferase family protein [Acinetobacter defluvii]|uniref:formyltransferase family protein n=1 Tax=Acinetobacter defluvii TaxID=1871111 RepID=UPI003AF788E3
MIKVIITGQKWFAEQLLLQCLQNGIKVISVIAPHDQDRLAICAIKHNIDVQYVNGVLDENLIIDGCDLILCAHAHWFVTKAARSKATMGALGYHPSLLPKYKGKNAIQDILDHKESVTGGSLYWLDDGWDTGCVYLQEACEISENDSAISLWTEKLAPLGLRLFNHALSRIGTAST